MARQLALSGTPPVTVHIRRSARARRLSLRVSQLDGRVTLTIPNHADEHDALSFAEGKSEWIRKHLARRPTREAVDIGTVLPVDGIPRKIIEGPGRTADLAGDTIAVSRDATGRRVKAMLVDRARMRLGAVAREFAARIDKPISAIAFRDTRSRWGSCSDKGRLMFSWRLIMAPPEVMAYVAAHEVAHLQELHHGPAFWALVDNLFGACEVERRWLRENAGTLHRFTF